MKRKILLLTVSILSVFLFQTGFQELENNSSFSFPSVPTSDPIQISGSLNQANESETETEVTIEAETEISTEDEPEITTGTETESTTEVETEVSTEAGTETITEAETELATETGSGTVTDIVTGGNIETEADADANLSESEAVAATSPETETENNLIVPAPEISQQFLTVNKWSRPGKEIKKVKKIVLHYLGNPGSSAQENRDYFESLKDSQNISLSSNFIVGLDGEIIQCMPEQEAACATYNLDRQSLSIETCHMDSTGKYLKDTYISLVKLTAYLSEKYNVKRKNIVRHYDVSGDKCPRYFVKNSDAWETFLDDVMLYRSLCKDKPKKAAKIKKYLGGLDYTYANKKEAKQKNKKKSKKETEAETEVVTDSSSDYNSDQTYYSEDYSYYDDSYYDYSYYDNTYYDNNYYYDNSYYDNSYYDNGYYDNGYYDTGYYDSSYYNQTYNEPSYYDPSYDAGNYEDNSSLSGDYSSDTW